VRKTWYISKSLLGELTWSRTVSIFRFGTRDLASEGVQVQLSREEERARRHECLDYAFWGKPHRVDEAKF
jgi:hypothetical protein